MCEKIEKAQRRVHVRMQDEGVISKATDEQVMNE